MSAPKSPLSNEPRTRVEGVSGEWYRLPTWRDVGLAPDDALDGYWVRYEGVLSDGNLLVEDEVWFVQRYDGDAGAPDGWYRPEVVEYWRIETPEGVEVRDLGSVHDHRGIAYASFERALREAEYETQRATEVGFDGTPDELAANGYQR